MTAPAPMTLPRGHRRSLRAVVGAVAVLAATAGVPTSAGAASADKAAGRWREVGWVSLPPAPEIIQDVVSSGWLILNPALRRGYQVYEGTTFTGGSQRARTVIQSFHLDTLKPLRRAVLAGVPITGGPADVLAVAATSQAGEVVHAVDPGASRVYLALSQSSFDKIPESGVAGFGQPTDGQRPLSRLVAIDELAFDRCGGEPNCDWVSSFREPAAQARLHHYWLEGLAVTRHGVGEGKPGRLLALFAQPQFGLTNNLLPAYDHTLAQWDPTNLEFDAGDALLTDPDPTLTITGEQEPGTQTVQQAGLVGAVRLDVCRGASLASGGSYPNGNYQWGVLATAEAVWTACQATDGAGGAARVPLQGDGILSPDLTL
jgi:hypothetical protein